MTLAQKVDAANARAQQVAATRTEGTQADAETYVNNSLYNIYTEQTREKTPAEEASLAVMKTTKALSDANIAKKTAGQNINSEARTNLQVATQAVTNKENEFLNNSAWYQNAKAKIADWEKRNETGDTNLLENVGMVFLKKDIANFEKTERQVTEEATDEGKAYTAAKDAYILNEEQKKKGLDTINTYTATLNSKEQSLTELQSAYEEQAKKLDTCKTQEEYITQLNAVAEAASAFRASAIDYKKTADDCSSYYQQLVDSGLDKDLEEMYANMGGFQKFLYRAGELGKASISEVLSGPAATIFTSAELADSVNRMQYKLSDAEQAVIDAFGYKKITEDEYNAYVNQKMKGYGTIGAYLAYKYNINSYKDYERYLYSASEKHEQLGLLSARRETAEETIGQNILDFRKSGQEALSRGSYGMNEWVATVYELGPSVAGMGTDAIMNMLVPGSSLVNMGTRVFGNSMSDAKNDGLDDGQAFAYASVCTAVEVGTEMLGGIGSKGAVYGEGILTEPIYKAIASMDNSILRKAAIVATTVGAEGAEEVIAEFFQPLCDALREYNDQTHFIDAYVKSRTDQTVDQYIKAFAGGALASIFGLGAVEIATRSAGGISPLTYQSTNLHGKYLANETKIGKYGQALELIKDQGLEKRYRTLYEKYGNQLKDVQAGDVLVDKNNKAVAVVVDVDAENGITIRYKNDSEDTVLPYGMLDGSNGQSNYMSKHNGHWGVADYLAKGGKFVHVDGTAVDNSEAEQEQNTDDHETTPPAGENPSSAIKPDNNGTPAGPSTPSTPAGPTAKSGRGGRESVNDLLDRVIGEEGEDALEKGHTSTAPAKASLTSTEMKDIDSTTLKAIATGGITVDGVTAEDAKAELERRNSSTPNEGQSAILEASQEGGNTNGSLESTDATSTGTGQQVNAGGEGTVNEGGEAGAGRDGRGRNQGENLVGESQQESKGETKESSRKVNGNKVTVRTTVDENGVEHKKESVNLSTKNNHIELEGEDGAVVLEESKIAKPILSICNALRKCGFISHFYIFDNGDITKTHNGVIDYVVEGMLSKRIGKNILTSTSKKNIVSHEGTHSVINAYKNVYGDEKTAHVLHKIVNDVFSDFTKGEKDEIINCILQKYEKDIEEKTNEHIKYNKLSGDAAERAKVYEKILTIADEIIANINGECSGYGIDFSKYSEALHANQDFISLIEEAAHGVGASDDSINELKEAFGIKAKQSSDTPTNDVTETEPVNNLIHEESSESIVEEPTSEEPTGQEVLLESSEGSATSQPAARAESEAHKAAQAKVDEVEKRAKALAEKSAPVVDRLNEMEDKAESKAANLFIEYSQRAKAVWERVKSKFGSAEARRNAFIEEVENDEEYKYWRKFYDISTTLKEVFHNPEKFGFKDVTNAHSRGVKYIATTTSDGKAIKIGLFESDMDSEIPIAYCDSTGFNCNDEITKRTKLYEEYFNSQDFKDVMRKANPEYYDLLDQYNALAEEDRQIAVERKAAKAELKTVEESDSLFIYGYPSKDDNRQRVEPYEQRMERARVDAMAKKNQLASEINPYDKESDPVSYQFWEIDRENRETELEKSILEAAKKGYEPSQEDIDELQKIREKKAEAADKAFADEMDRLLANATQSELAEDPNKAESKKINSAIRALEKNDSSQLHNLNTEQRLRALLRYCYRLGIRASKGKNILTAIGDYISDTDMLVSDRANMATTNRDLTSTPITKFRNSRTGKVRYEFTSDALIESYTNAQEKHNIEQVKQDKGENIRILSEILASIPAEKLDNKIKWEDYLDEKNQTLTEEEEESFFASEMLHQYGFGKTESELMSAMHDARNRADALKWQLEEDKSLTQEEIDNIRNDINRYETEYYELSKAFEQINPYEDQFEHKSKDENLDVNQTDNVDLFGRESRQESEWDKFKLKTEAEDLGHSSIQLPSRLREGTSTSALGIHKGLGANYPINGVMQNPESFSFASLEPTRTFKIVRDKTTGGMTWVENYEEAIDASGAPIIVPKKTEASVVHYPIEVSAANKVEAKYKIAKVRDNLAKAYSSLIRIQNEYEFAKRGVQERLRNAYDNVFAITASTSSEIQHLANIAQLNIAYLSTRDASNYLVSSKNGTETIAMANILKSIKDIASMTKEGRDVAFEVAKSNIESVTDTEQIWNVRLSMAEAKLAQATADYESALKSIRSSANPANHKDTRLMASDFVNVKDVESLPGIIDNIEMQIENLSDGIEKTKANMQDMHDDYDKKRMAQENIDSFEKQRADLIFKRNIANQVLARYGHIIEAPNYVENTGMDYGDNSEEIPSEYFSSADDYEYDSMMLVDDFKKDTQVAYHLASEFFGNETLAQDFVTKDLPFMLASRKFSYKGTQKEANKYFGFVKKALDSVGFQMDKDSITRDGDLFSATISLAPLTDTGTANGPITAEEQAEFEQARTQIEDEKVAQNPYHEGELSQDFDEQAPIDIIAGNPGSGNANNPEAGTSAAKDTQESLYNATFDSVDKQEMEDAANEAGRLTTDADDAVHGTDAEKTFTKNLHDLATGHMNLKAFYDYYRGLRTDSEMSIFHEQALEDALEEAMNAEKAMYAGAGARDAVLRYRSSLINATKRLSTRFQRNFDANRDKADAVKTTKSKNAIKNFGGWARSWVGNTGTIFKAITGFCRDENSVGYKLAKKVEDSVIGAQEMIARANRMLYEFGKEKSSSDFINGKLDSGVTLLWAKGTMEAQQALGLYATLRTLQNKNVDISKIRHIWLRDAQGDYECVEVNIPKKDAKGLPIKNKIEDGDLVKFYGSMSEIMHSEKATEAGKVMAKAYDSWAKVARYFAPQLGDTYRAINGVELGEVTDDDYFPIHYKSRDDVDVQWDFDMQKNLNSMSIVNDRVDGKAFIPVIPTFMAAANSYINQATNYTAFAELSDQLKLMDKSTEGNLGLSSRMGNALGARYAEWYKNYIKTLDNDHGPEKEGFQKVLQGARSVTQKGILIGNPMVPVKQVSSYWSAMSVLSPTSLMLARSTRLGSMVQVLNRSAKYRSDIIDYRIQGGIDPTLAEIMKSSTNPNRIQRLIDNSPLVKLANNAIPFMDVTTVNNLYTATVYDVAAANPDVNTDSAKFAEMVEQKFAEVVFKTQPIFNPQARAEYARTDNEYIRLTSMFQTQQNQNLNNLIVSLGEYMNGIKNKNLSDADKSKLSHTIKGQLVASISFSILSMLGDALLHKWKKYRPDDDDETLAGNIAERLMLNMAENLASVVPFGDSIAKASIDAIASAVNEDTDINEFYGVSLGVVSNIYTMIKDFEYYKETPSRYRMARLIKDASTIGGAWAINNGYTIANAIAMWVIDLNGDNPGGYDDYLRWAHLDTASELKLTGDELQYAEDYKKAHHLNLSDIDDDYDKGLVDDDVYRDYLEFQHRNDNQYLQETTRDKIEESMNIAKFRKDTGINYNKLSELYLSDEDDHISADQVIEARMSVAGDTYEEAQQYVYKQDFKKEYGVSYDQMAELYENKGITASDVVKWRTKCGSSQTSAEHWVEKQNLSIKTGVEYDGRYTDNSWDSYSTNEKMGIISFYDNYGAEFSSDKVFGEVFNALNNSIDTYENKPDIKHPNFSKYGYLSDNQKSKIYCLRDLISSGKITKEIAKIIWTEHLGYSDYYFNTYMNG